MYMCTYTPATDELKRCLLYVNVLAPSCAHNIDIVKSDYVAAILWVAISTLMCKHQVVHWFSKTTQNVYLTLLNCTQTKTVQCTLCVHI